MGEFGKIVFATAYVMINILMSRSHLIHPKIKPALETYIKPGMKVTAICLSFFDSQYPTKERYDLDYQKDGQYYVKIVEQLIPFGIPEKDITWVHYFDDDQADSIHKIATADILFFPGGAPERLMDRIHEKGLYDVINKHQKIYIGVSAGAMIQLKHYHISPDADYPSFSYQEGLDLLTGFFVEVHYRRKKKQKSSMRRVFRAYKQPLYTIPDDGCLIVDHDKIKVINTAKLYYEKQGVVR